MRLAGKIGIVTAAASGMGRAGALRFAREGAQVAVVDVDAAGVKRVVDEITAAGGIAHGIAADLTKDEDSRRIVWDTVNRFKGLDFVWNHVGHPGPAAIEGIDMSAFNLAVDLNLRTVLITTEAAIPEHPRPRWRESPLYGVHLRPRGVRLQPGLLDVQVRGGGLRQEPGAPAGVRKDSRERGLSRPDRHADAAGVRLSARSEVDGRNGSGGSSCANALTAPCRWAARPARRDRQRGAVPPLGRSLVRHGRRAPGRRWRDRGLTAREKENVMTRAEFEAESSFVTGMRSVRARSNPTCTVRRTPTTLMLACSCWTGPSRSSSGETGSTTDRATPAAFPPERCTKNTPTPAACATSPAGARPRVRPPLDSARSGQAFQAGDET